MAVMRSSNIRSCDAAKQYSCCAMKAIHAIKAIYAAVMRSSNMAVMRSSSIAAMRNATKQYSC